MRNTKAETAMAWMTTAAMMPLLILFSVPLAVFAAFTTTLAFWLLLFRVTAVHIELLAALLKAWLVPSTIPDAPSPLRPSTPKQNTPTSRRASHSMVTYSGPVGPIGLKSQSSATLAIGTPFRDYEGVGGWRLEGDEEEEALWMGINSRPELPSAQTRRHRRSFTGSRAPSGRSSPEQVRTPLAIRTSNRSRPGSGRSSPEGYFTMPLTFTPTTDRYSKVSFEGHKKSNRSSSSSLGGSSSVKLTRHDVN